MVGKLSNDEGGNFGLFSEAVYSNLSSYKSSFLLFFLEYKYQQSNKLQVKVAFPVHFFIKNTCFLKTFLLYLQTKQSFFR